MQIFTICRRFHCKASLSTILQQKQSIAGLSRCYSHSLLSQVSMKQGIPALSHLKWIRVPTNESRIITSKSFSLRLSSSIAQEKEDTGASTAFPDTTGFNGNINGIPKPALYIGFAGAIPFIALSIASGIHLPFPLAIAKAQASYAACILTFLGAIHWGKALEQEQPNWKSLAYSVTPSIYAWGTFALPTQLSLYFLSAGLLGAYIVDIREQGFPKWYRSLRMPLSLISVSCVLLTAYNTPLFC